MARCAANATRVGEFLVVERAIEVHEGNGIVSSSLSLPLSIYTSILTLTRTACTNAFIDSGIHVLHTVDNATDKVLT